MIQETVVAGPTIEVISEAGHVPAALQAALDRLNAVVSLRHPDADPADATPDARVILAENLTDSDGAIARATDQKQIWDQCVDRPCATLVIGERTHPLSRSDELPPGLPPGLPISFIEEVAVEELIGRLAAMCAFKPSLRHYEDELESFRMRDVQPADPPDHWQRELRLAAQVQRDLLPDPNLDLGPLRIDTLFRPADDLSGDIYDILRLDERRVGISVADATGHGLPAALLTLFVKRAFRGKEITEDGYRLVPPDQVLARVNRELFDADLSQCQYVTGLYACYDHATDEIIWARGGLPYPILVQEDRPPECIRSPGGLMGAFLDQTYESQSLPLGAGQGLIFHTDGLDAILLHAGKTVLGEDITTTDWFQTLRTGNLAEHLDEIRTRLDETPDDRWPKDDVTVLALTR